MIPKVSQGTLSNGMRFYSCPFYKLPENEVTFSIVLRKTDQANSLPSFDFFEEAMGYKKAFAQSAYNVTPELYSFTLSIRGNYPLSITSILNAFADYLENLDMSVDCIEEIRKEYAEDLGEENSERKGSIHLHTLSDDQIKDLYRGLFNPSQMAIVITGGFDSTDLEVDLENSLGKIVGNELSGAPFYKKAPYTIAMREKLPENITDQAFSSENRVGYEYVYFVSPTFKGHVLKDLFRLMGLEQGIILPPGSFYYPRLPQDPYRFANLYPRESLFSKEKITNFECNKHVFGLSKERLLAIYRKLSMFDDLTESSHSTIISHFVSGVSESLEDSRNFERVLEDITFEDFQIFVEQNFSQIKYFEKE